jgi:hypothetical protein
MSILTVTSLKCMSALTPNILKNVSSDANVSVKLDPFDFTVTAFHPSETIIEISQVYEIPNAMAPAKNSF